MLRWIPNAAYSEFLPYLCPAYSTAGLFLRRAALIDLRQCLFRCNRAAFDLGIGWSDAMMGRRRERVGAIVILVVGASVTMAWVGALAYIGSILLSLQ